MINKGAESLPNKDAQTYKQLAKFYDAKNYKKGLKNADKLLEIHPDHPQTNALKALFLLATNEENKALEIAKFALMKSKLKSMFCWHTCGTIYKQKKDFFEAAKCFQNALRMQPDNVQLMRQTASLQIQVRDHTNHTATRFSILKQKPNMIQNWVGFTLAHHLRGDFPSLFKALTSLDNLIKTTQLKPTELAHYYLYRVIAFRDAGKWEEVFQELKKNKEKIKDEVMYHELLHQVCVELGKPAEAEVSLQFLIKKFPENIDYLKKYKNLNRLSSREAYAKARQVFHSKIAKIHQLAYVSDDTEFKQQFSSFIKPYYRKNLISLFTEIQALYQAGKGKLIEQIFLLHEVNLEKGVYPDNSEIDSPTEYLWSLYLLAQHYGQYFQTLPKAHAYISKAIAHTCTVPEFYLVKAEIEYKQHNNLSTVKTINEARKTDLADRYMNNICVKYLMRCQKPDLGENVLRLFMRDDSSLYQLQNHWYIIEAAKSLLKQRNIEAGLRHLDFISKQFIDFQGNQLDFHTYCLRKWTLRQYTELIAFNDNIYDDKKYVEAAGLALRYLKQYVYKLEEDKLEEERIAKELEKQKQEEQTKQEKEQKKKKKKKKATQQQNIVEQSTQQGFRKRIDYSGKQYCEKIKKNPLEQALNYSKCISTIIYTNKQNQRQNKLFGRAFEQSIDIFIHFKKPLLVLRLLKKLSKTNFCPFALHFATLKSVLYFIEYLKDPKANDIAKELVTEYLDATLAGKSLGDYHMEVVSKWNNVKAQSQYLIQIKKLEADIILKSNDQRSDFIHLYLKQIAELAISSEITSSQLQLIFYITHKLQFYGKLSEQLKKTLEQRLKERTTYYSEWREEVNKLPDSTWTMWWLSDYDIEREEIEEKEEAKKEKQAKELKQVKQELTAKQ